ncbi:ABC transporter family protein [Leishmania donovani]|uniref:ABC transporter family protein n=1 Tax=Leishmania donovani TaxID=5661 RepID=A0A504Y1B1_LEIDO|nr:ABC transporter family protein [Leishmania donovani]
MIRTDYFFRSYQRMADALQLHAVRKLFKAPVSYFDRFHPSALADLVAIRTSSRAGRCAAESIIAVIGAVNGAITIRAFGSVCRTACAGMNEHSTLFTSPPTPAYADRWVALRLEFVALALTSALALLPAAFAGLGIISSMTASRSLSMLCRRFGMFQNQFVSAEQLLRLEEEIPEEIHQQPQRPQLPWVLSDICFTLRPGECVGLMANYFQLVSQEPLLLQGTCRSNLILGLDDGSAASREASGEPRVTVDAEALDVRLSAVLRKVALDELLEPSYAVPAPGQPAVTGSDGEVASSATRDAAESASDSTASPTSTVDVATRALDHVVTAGGSNLSAGQRQLLCLARAILHRPHVVLLDEVSSRVDRRTDDLIQRVIKEEMLCRGGKDNGDSSAVKSGVLLIAHRLETIMSLCDSVIVIEKGRCVAHLSKEEVNCLEDLESYL